MTDAEVIRFAVIGCGHMGQEHIRNLALIDGVAVVAVADPDPCMLAAATNLAGKVDAWADYRRLVDAGGFDAVVVASPNHTHHDIMIDLFTSGVPVLVEKPLGITASECRAIIDAAGANAHKVWVAMEYRYMPPIAYLLDAVNAGRVGKAKMIAIREHRYPFLDKVNHWNRFNANTGGTLVEKCCHFFDLFTLIAHDEAVRVYASGAMDVNHRDEIYDGETPDIIDNAFVTVEFRNGLRAMLDLCMFSEGTVWQERISVSGDSGGIEALIPGPSNYAPNSVGRDARVIHYPRSGSPAEEHAIDVDSRLLEVGNHHGACYFQQQKFIEMIRSDGVPAVGLGDGLRAVVMGEAAELSARTGEAVTLPRS